MRGLVLSLGLIFCATASQALSPSIRASERSGCPVPSSVDTSSTRGASSPLAAVKACWMPAKTRPSAWGRHREGVPPPKKMVAIDRPAQSSFAAARSSSRTSASAYSASGHRETPYELKSQ